MQPNLDNDKDFNIKCNQFESLLDSFEEEIKILKIEKERKGQVENLIKDTKDCKVNPENEENVELIVVNHLNPNQGGLFGLSIEWGGGFRQLPECIFDVQISQKGSQMENGIFLNLWSL